MPDLFGNPTPKEAAEAVRQRFAEQRAAFAKTQLARTQGGQLGQSLGNIFGGFIKKSLDTSAARKSEAQRLVEETGISLKEARDMAKENVPRDFREVRKAKQIKKAGLGARELVESLTSSVGPVLARAAGMILMAGDLRRLDFADEATAMTLQAQQIRQEEESRLANLDNLRARTRSSVATAKLAEEKLGDVGETDFTRLVNKAEEIRTAIDISDDPAEIEAQERALGRIESQISKRNTITGTTENDPSFLSKAGRNKQATELFELNVLKDKLGFVVETLLENKGNFAATFLGRMSAGFLGFMEDTVGYDIGDDGDKLLQAVADIGGGAAFVSAQIRHALTGAAMSPAEAVFLEPFLAQPGDSLTQMLSKVRVVQKYTSLDIETRQRLLDSGRAGRVFFVEATREARDEIRAEKSARRDASSTAIGATTGATDAEALDAVTGALAVLEARGDL